MKNINNESDYSLVMAKITKDELEEIRQLALAAQAYEQTQYAIEAPTTLIGMVEMRMFEMKLKQKELAKKLKVSDAKLSLIMNGKQKPGIDFLKTIRTKLNIDADFILEHV